jgi:AraC family transcriptional regulator
MTATLAFDATVYRAGTRHRPHQHDELHMSVVLSGSVAETVRGVTEYAEPLSVVVKEAGVVHADEFGPSGARIARLVLCGGTVAAIIDDPRRGSAWGWTHNGPAPRAFVRLLCRANSGARTFSADDADVVDLLAALTARRSTSSGTPPAWLAQTMEEVRHSWHPALTVSAVARRAGVHPVYLARCVRRWYGTSVAQELRRLRVRSAVQTIVESDSTVSNVAHELGYADEPHLCREFKGALGLTPGRYRALLGKLLYRRSEAVP